MGWIHTWVVGLGRGCLELFRLLLLLLLLLLLKMKKIRVTLCENAAGALYILNKMCVDGRRNDAL